MSVLQQILDWSHDRPLWQRDALRRLVIKNDLDNDDINALTEICKGAHGLAVPAEAAPLAKEHVPEQNSVATPVSLASIFHHRGVNALAEGQTLRFGPHLTVVYGDNAAGKTGYIRILKSACRARGQEKILGNVVSGTTPLAPVVAIKYRVGDEAELREWAGAGEDQFVSRVSVFDTQCAAVYLTEKTDVAFRPFGLDLFDKLVKACKAVRANLEREQRAVATSTLTSLQTQVPEGTSVAKLLANITSLTRPDAVKTLARLSAEDEDRLGFLENSLRDLEANDPERLIRQLTLRVARVKGLARHLERVEATLSAQAIEGVFALRSQGHHKSAEFTGLREATFVSATLPGTGSENWGGLWESARKYSQEDVYPGRLFPVVGSNAHCVLCQQTLDAAASDRLQRFETFVTSQIAGELRQIREKFLLLRKSFVDLETTNSTLDETIEEIRLDDDVLATAIATATSTNEARRAAVVAALSGGGDLASDCPASVPVHQEIDAFASHLEARIAALREGSNRQTRARLNAEAQELRSRKLLLAWEQTVLDEIERRKRHAAYGLCLEETKTHAITQKSSAVTKDVVSQRLKLKFAEELANLSFRHVEVELQDVGGAEGVLYHKLVLTRAPGVDLPRVVSEGEQRCLSIAAFFADLSTADDPSGIVFDDPVSSLDYRWREGVAQRLVQEAGTRQVIVFTHDVVFLLLLKQYAETLGVDQLDQHVRHLSKGAGVCIEELPWVAMPVKKRIGYLKNGHQAATKLFRDGHQDAYEKEATYLYGLLRKHGSERSRRSCSEGLSSGIARESKHSTSARLQISALRIAQPSRPP